MIAPPHRASGPIAPIGRPAGSPPNGARALTLVDGRAPERGATQVPARALVCDAIGTLLSARGAPVGAGTLGALARARDAGLLVAIVHDGWPVSEGDVRAAIGPVDLVVTPHPGERTAGRRDELQPRFVERTCRRLGVEPSSCVVMGGRRALLAAAAWVGARTVMVPNDATPLFHLRGQRHLAPDLATAIATLLEAEGAS